MTDITELAQSLKAGGISPERMEWLKKLADMKYCASNPGHWLMSLKETNYLAVVALQCLEKNLALVEALEKAQTKADVYDMLRDDYGLREKGVGLADFVDWQAKRISELESRTATVENLQDSAYRAGLTAGWNLGLANNNDGFNKCLAARCRWHQGGY
ncbi:TPA: hypothetical protein RRW20_001811 [Klebsiella pneumoniae]|nr:hypothetical protein [Klebsiella pneumoniae]